VNSTLEYFILGILLVAFFLPVLDGLTSLVLTAIEAAKCWFGLKIAATNKKITESDEKPMSKIGFVFDEEDDQEEEEEDE
jgi:hypothetical protein